MNIEYINAVENFNSLKSFVITLPIEESYYSRLIINTNDIILMTEKLRILEERKVDFTYDDVDTVHAILTLVVHLNQVSNGVK